MPSIIWLIVPLLFFGYCTSGRSKGYWKNESTESPTLNNGTTWAPTTNITASLKSLGINCRPQVIKAIEHLKREGLQLDSSNQRPFMEPILHTCLKAHRYNTQQLPFRLGSKIRQIEMTYNFFFNSLLSLESDGAIELKAFLRLEWHDEHRVWDPDQVFGVRKIKVPIYEVWTPLLQVANCELENCYLLPHNRSTVGLEYNGLVTLGIQLYTKATCDLDLVVRSNCLRLRDQIAHSQRRNQRGGGAKGAWPLCKTLAPPVKCGCLLLNLASNKQQSLILLTTSTLK